MNKKGLTIIEIIISLVLISLILVFLFRLLTQLRNEDMMSKTKSELYATQAIVTRNLNDDFEELGLKQYDVSTINCGISNSICANLTFQDSGNGEVKKRLIIFKTEGNYYNAIRYVTILSSGEEHIEWTRKLPDKVIFDIQNDELLFSKNDDDATYALVFLEIPILDENGNNYDIKISYFYKKGEILFKNASPINFYYDDNLVYTKKTRVNELYPIYDKSLPTKTNYYFAGWYDNEENKINFGTTIFNGEKSELYSRFVKQHKITINVVGGTFNDGPDTNNTQKEVYISSDENDTIVISLAPEKYLLSNGNIPTSVNITCDEGIVHNGNTIGPNNISNDNGKCNISFNEESMEPINYEIILKVNGGTFNNGLSQTTIYLLPENYYNISSTKSDYRCLNGNIPTSVNITCDENIVHNGNKIGPNNMTDGTCNINLTCNQVSSSSSSSSNPSNNTIYITAHDGAVANSVLTTTSTSGATTSITYGDPNYYISNVQSDKYLKEAKVKCSTGVSASISNATLSINPGTQSGTCHVVFPKVFYFETEIYDVPVAGKYLLEVWGADGSSYPMVGNSGGVGGASVGTINLTNNEHLYINVGGMGEIPTAGYNGGGLGGKIFASSSGDTYQYAGGGGGASDIRINENTLYNRVIVAGGGGGFGYSASFNSGGAGGGINGNDSAPLSTNANANAYYKGSGGTQSSGGTVILAGDAGQFGKGGSGRQMNIDYHAIGGGGGGGWFGGSSGGTDYATYAGGGGGGSGFVYTAETASIATAISGWNLNSSYYLTDAQTSLNSNISENHYCTMARYYSGTNNFGKLYDGCVIISFVE